MEDSIRPQYLKLIRWLFLQWKCLDAPISTRKGR